MIKETSTPAITTSLVKSKIKKIPGWKSLYIRYFFVVMASVFIIMAVIGFGEDYHTFYTQHITVNWFAHVHGVLLTGWLLVFLTQAILVVKGNLKFHRQLGQFSVVLGVLVWISMGIVIFHAHIGYPLHSNISWAIVMLLFMTMNLFGLFFTWAVIKRKNAAAHKRLLFLATLVLIAAGFNRILLYGGIDPTLHWLSISGIANVSLSGMPNMSAILLYDDLLLIPLFIYDFVTLRSIHKITLIGVGFIVGIHITVTILWGSLT